MPDFTRVAGAITPIFGNILINEASSLATFASYAGVSALAVIAAAALPFDTLGRDADSGQQRATEKSPLVGEKREPLMVAAKERV